MTDGFRSAFELIEIPEVYGELGNFSMWLTIKLQTLKQSCEFHAELCWGFRSSHPFSTVYSSWSWQLQMNLNIVKQFSTKQGLLLQYDRNLLLICKLYDRYRGTVHHRQMICVWLIVHVHVHVELYM